MIFSKIFPSPLVMGSQAPAFELHDQTGQIHRLSDYAGRWLVLYFYPKDDTPGCTAEACSFRDSIDVYRQKSIAVLGVSSDDVESHKNFSDKYSLPFPILADPQKTVVRAYGASWLFGMTNRITFLIDPQGCVADRLDWVRWDTYANTVLDRISKLQKNA